MQNISTDSLVLPLWVISGHSLGGWGSTLCREAVDVICIYIYIYIYIYMQNTYMQNIYIYMCVCVCVCVCVSVCTCAYIYIYIYIYMCIYICVCVCVYMQNISRIHRLLLCRGYTPQPPNECPDITQRGRTC